MFEFVYFGFMLDGDCVCLLYIFVYDMCCLTEGVMASLLGWVFAVKKNFILKNIRSFLT